MSLIVFKGMHAICAPHPRGATVLRSDVDTANVFFLYHRITPNATLYVTHIVYIGIIYITTTLVKRVIRVIQVERNSNSIMNFFLYSGATWGCYGDATVLHKISKKK